MAKKKCKKAWLKAVKQVTRQWLRCTILTWFNHNALIFVKLENISLVDDFISTLIAWSLYWKIKSDESLNENGERIWMWETGNEKGWE